jgi:hypothetical protein
MATNFPLPLARELLGGLLLDVVLVGNTLGHLYSKVVIREGPDVKVCLAVREHEAAVLLLEDIGPEVYEVEELFVAEELRERSHPWNRVGLLPFCEVKGGLPGRFGPVVDGL